MRKPKERGEILPTQKELRAAAKAKREAITEESVNKLIEERPVTEQEDRVNNPTVMHFESSPNKRHPLRFREIHEQVMPPSLSLCCLILRGNHCSFVPSTNIKNRRGHTLQNSLDISGHSLFSAVCQ